MGVVSSGLSWDSKAATTGTSPSMTGSRMPLSLLDPSALISSCKYRYFSTCTTCGWGRKESFGGTAWPLCFHLFDGFGSAHSTLGKQHADNTNTNRRNMLLSVDYGKRLSRENGAACMAMCKWNNDPIYLAHKVVILMTGLNQVRLRNAGMLMGLFTKRFGSTTALPWKRPDD